MDVMGVGGREHHRDAGNAEKSLNHRAHRVDIGYRVIKIQRGERKERRVFKSKTEKWK
jgi:hypothetical protein